MQAALVKIDVAAARLGWSAAKLFDLADGGAVTASNLFEKGFVWVFDLANDLASQNGRCGSHRRDLRFWWPEIEARASDDTSKHGKFSSYEIEWVINKILPVKRQNFHAGEVDQMFQIRPRTRIDLHAELFPLSAAAGERAGVRCPNFYPRAALVNFLQRRWLGAVSARVGTTSTSLPNRIKPADHRLAVNSQGDAVPATGAGPQAEVRPRIVAASSKLTPACGGGNVHTTQQRGGPDRRAAINFVTEETPTPRTRKAAPITPVRRGGVKTHADERSVTIHSSTKSPGHIPASPATTMQRRKSATIPAPASLSGAGNFPVRTPSTSSQK